MKPMSPLWKGLLWISTVAVIVAEFLGPTKELHEIWDYKTFFAVYGFVGCVGIIFVSKAIGKYWVQKKESYYEGSQAPEPGSRPEEERRV